MRKANVFALPAALMILILLSGCKGSEAAESKDMPEAPVPVIEIREDPQEVPAQTVEDGGSGTADGPDEEGQAAESDAAGDAFYITEITDEIFSRMEGKSFSKDCTLPREDLRYLHVLHKTLDGSTREGELVVNVHIAEDVLDIFRELYEAGYPIEKIKLVDEYDADDERSMEDNNTSCFNFRFVPRTTTVSKHGRGLAIDVNPFYNPYITTVDGALSVEPKGAEAYADRSGDFPYRIDENDTAYRIFTAHGFVWGGAWKNSKDYQHFEIPSEQIREWYP